MCVCVSVRVYVCVVCVRVGGACLCVCVRICVCVYVYIYIKSYNYRYIYVYTHISICHHVHKYHNCLSTGKSRQSSSYRLMMVRPLIYKNPHTDRECQQYCYQKQLIRCRASYSLTAQHWGSWPQQACKSDPTRSPLQERGGGHHVVCREHDVTSRKCTCRRAYLTAYPRALPYQQQAVASISTCFCAIV